MMSGEFQRLLRSDCGRKKTSHRFRLVLAAGIVAFSALLLSPLDAKAKGFFVVNTGKEMFEMGGVPPELAEYVPDFGWKLGYMCSRFGIFWADLWTWDCELVAFKDDTYTDFPPEIRSELESIYPMSEAERGVWNRYGVWCFVGLIGLGVLMGNRDEGGT